MALVMESFWHRVRYTRLRDVLRGRVDGRLDWRRAVAEAELPIELDEAISQVVRKSKLWKYEQPDVAVELVSHFKDGLEAGVTSEALLGSFGDLNQAAKLIRSSKRRCRPLWWQGWWWASRSAAGLLATYVLMVFLLAFDKPVVSTDYLAVVNAKYVAVPEEERAWPHYMVALEWLKENTEPSRVHADAENTSIEDWLSGPEDGETNLIDEYLNLTDIEREVADQWLDERAEFLELVRKATKYKRLGLEAGIYSPRYRELFGIPLSIVKPGGEEESMYSVLLSHVQAMRGISRILRADFKRSVARGDGTKAQSNLEALIGVVRHSGDGPWLICGGVKCGLLKFTIESIETVLAMQPEIWSDEQLITTAHLLGSIRLEVGDYVPSEMASFYDIVQRIYSDDGNGEGYLTAEGLRQMDREFQPMLAIDGRQPKSFYSEWQYKAAAPASFLIAASRRELIAKHGELWAKMQAEASRPLWDPMPVEETIHGWFKQISQIEKYRYAPLMMLMPGFQSAANRFEKAKGRLEGALCGIALELYRRKNGEWPDSLERLSPGLLPGVPVDRINGGALGYRIVDGLPVIYSLGVDGDDDGGRVPMVIGVPKPLHAAPNDALTYNRHLREDPRYDGDWVIWDLRESEVGIRNAE